MRKVVISGPPPVQILDVTGPLEVFSNVPDYQIEIVSWDGTGQLRTALSVARQLVMFLVRPGGQAQYSHMLSRQATTSEPLRVLQVYMLENLKANLSVEALAERIGMSPRHFSRVCLREMKMNPVQLVDRLRVEAAKQMI